MNASDSCWWLAPWRSSVTPPTAVRRLQWLLALLERRPRKLAAAALANKMARIAWAMMTTGETYRHSRLSNTIDSGFCVEAPEEALARRGKPRIFDTDQGAQFTSCVHRQA